MPNDANDGFSSVIDLCSSSDLTDASKGQHGMEVADDVSDSLSSRETTIMDGDRPGSVPGSVPISPRHVAGKSSHRASPEPDLQLERSSSQVSLSGSKSISNRRILSRGLTMLDIGKTTIDLSELGTSSSDSSDSDDSSPPHSASATRAAVQEEPAVVSPRGTPAMPIQRPGARDRNSVFKWPEKFAAPMSVTGKKMVRGLFPRDFEPEPTPTVAGGSKTREAPTPTMKKSVESRFTPLTPRAPAFKWPELAAATPRVMASRLTKSLFGGAQRVHPGNSESASVEQEVHGGVSSPESSSSGKVTSAVQDTSWRLAPGRSPRKRVSIREDPIFIFQCDAAAIMNGPLPPIRNAEESEIERTYSRGWFRSIIAILLD